MLHWSEHQARGGGQPLAAHGRTNPTRRDVFRDDQRCGVAGDAQKGLRTFSRALPDLPITGKSFGLLSSV